VGHAKLSGMSFHESFRVVAGTAAPVIALAAVVSLSKIIRTQAPVDEICVVAPTAGVLLLAHAGLAVTSAQERRVRTSNP
jgi:hypothetical protein